jgi:hypothetical protein
MQDQTKARLKKLLKAFVQKKFYAKTKQASASLWSCLHLICGLPIVYMDWTKHVIEYESNSDIF